MGGDMGVFGDEEEIIEFANNVDKDLEAIEKVLSRYNEDFKLAVLALVIEKRASEFGVTVSKVYDMLHYAMQEVIGDLGEPE